MAVERLMTRAAGIKNASVSFTSGSALLEWDPDKTNLQDVFNRIKKLGYQVSPLIGAEEVEQKLDEQARRVGMRLIIAVFFGMWSMLASLILYVYAPLVYTIEGWWLGIASLVFAAPVLTYSAWDFYRAGWRTARAGVPGMDALISTGVVASTALSVWQLMLGTAHIYIDTATMLVTFLLIGRLIELHARKRNAGALSALRQAVPEMVRVRHDNGSEEEIPVEQVATGAVAIVHAGERIPVDGNIIEGHSQCDNAILTGEAQPVHVAPGSTVLAGGVNLDSQLSIRITVAGNARQLDKLGLKMLEIYGAKSSSAVLAEKFSRALVPVAIVLSVLAFALGLWQGETVVDAVMRAVSVLVAACPCAVGLALPLAYAAASGQAARAGILLRDPASLEALANANSILFDKTGTLTVGKPRVVDILAKDGNTDNILSLAASAEAGIAHPLAQAIVLAAKDRQIDLIGTMNATGVRHPQGVAWRDDQTGDVLVGAATWLQAQQITIPDTFIQQRPGTTRIEVAHQQQWIGALFLRDVRRDDSTTAITGLKQRGLSLALVTGDAQEAAATVATELGIDSTQLHAACLPQDKVTVISQAQNPVVFVGDGINDMLALAAADCGIAVQGASTAAVASAGIVISKGGLMQVIYARELAQRTLRITRQNLALSFGYNAIVLLMAVNGMIPPVAAAIAMSVSSISVALNALRLTTPAGNR